MENKFNVSEEEDKLLIHNFSKKLDYMLTVDLDHYKDNFWNVIFKWNLPKEKFPVFITARDFKNYDEDVQEILFDPTKQYVEIGAGLGEFIPRLVSEFNGDCKNLPIVIDPANYNLMQKMLKEGINQSNKRKVEGDIINRLETLIERCRIFRDSSKVKLINTSLGQALSEYPELKGLADFVIENRGAHYYPQVEFPEGEKGQNIKNLGKIHELRDSLLKQGGRYVGG